jgi:diguanylate cyclase (GGDEF)-like protein/PAS domain S-box-containing protein
MSGLASIWRTLATELATRVRHFSFHCSDRSQILEPNTARRLIETSIDLILVTDRHGSFIQVSPSSAAIVGHQPEEMVGRSAVDFIYPHDLEAIREEMRAARRGKGTRTFETRYFHKDGHLVTLACTGVWSEEDQQHYFIGRDMTERNQAEDRLNGQKLMLDAALDNMSHGICVFDSSGRIVLFNRRYGELMEEPADFLMGRSVLDLWRHRKQIGKFSGNPEEAFAKIMRAVEGGRTETKLLERDDGRTLRVIDQPMRGGGWVATFEDITEQRQVERERDRSREFLNLIVENVPSAIFVKDITDGRYVLINRAGEKFWGLARQEMVGKTAEDIFPPEEARRIAARDQEMLRSGKPLFDEREMITPNHGIRSIHSRRLVISDGRASSRYLLGVIDDVTERKLAEARIAHLAHYDGLTGLANRALFREQLEKELTLVRRGGQIAVFYLDLDHFKTVNDTLGHSIGDELLKAVAARLQSCLRDCDHIARLGGDEFAVVRTGLAEAKEADSLAQRLRQVILENPFNLNGHQAVVDLSVGIALSPGDGTDLDELLKHADLALYGAKSEGRGTYRYFEPEMNIRMKRRRSLEFDLRKALSGGELQVHYQPLVNLQSRAIVGCEALLRWQHPERGMISPAEFIPVAEETGLINAIGAWVLRQACVEATKWPGNVKVAVNVSPLQFRNQNLAQTVLSALAASRLAAERLELEVTESVLMQNNEATLAALHQLRALGVRISLDDFGTGFSSLSYLRRFPFNKIKIDRSFINDLTRGPHGLTMVQAILNLAEGLKMTTTAEGVETAEQETILREAGCAEMQGFVFSRALPPSAISALFQLDSKTTNAA